MLAGLTWLSEHLSNAALAPFARLIDKLQSRRKETVKAAHARLDVGVVQKRLNEHKED
jgi:hypothetical protein